MKPFQLGTKYDGLEIIEVVSYDEKDDYQPYLYMLSDGNTVWIPVDESEKLIDIV